MWMRRWGAGMDESWNARDAVEHSSGSSDLIGGAVRWTHDRFPEISTLDILV